MVPQGKIREILFSYPCDTVTLTSYKLTEEESSRLIEKLQADSDAGTDQKFQWSSAQSAFEDHLVWVYAFLSFWCLPDFVFLSK